MKNIFKKLLSFALVGIMAVGIMTGCGSGYRGDNSGTKGSFSGKGVKIGVLVADVSGEEAQGLRSYYEDYIA